MPPPAELFLEAISMRQGKAGHPLRFTQFSFVMAAVLLLTSFCTAQAVAPSQSETPLAQELNKYPGLVPELGRLMEKIQHNVQNPPARNQSKLLPLLPPSTTYYAAFPNYGEAAHQILTTFRLELKESAVLRDWWHQGDMAKAGPEFEDFLEKFYQLSQYLGEEIVVSGDTAPKGHNFLMIAEVRKPGLKDFLSKMLKELPDKSKQNVRVLDLQDLAGMKGVTKASEPVVLVRPDFVIVAPDLDSVRSVNRLLDSKSADFASTPFGQRVVQAYQGGSSLVAAADLHKMLSQVPKEPPAARATLERSGFNDVKYLVWNHSGGADHTVSEMELTFIGPRHGAAAWLAAPAPLGSLDFVSPKTAFVLALQLKNLAEIFDDIKALSGDSNPGPFATLPQMEQAMHISLRDDVLSQLSGEIAFELKELAGQQPVWTAILRVREQDRLAKTLDQLFQHLPVQTRQSSEDGIEYHSVVVPSPQKAVEIAYAFVDGYLIVASSRQSAAAAVQLHRSGESLSKSVELAKSLPPGYSTQASAVLYENASAMTPLYLRQLPAEVREAVMHSTPETTPIAFTAYGEESAIRTVSAGGGATVGAILVGSAIAIPNLLRARMAANEAGAIGALRTVDTAQIAYAASYPQRGFARSLAALGPDPRGGSAHSAEHANMLDASLGDASCTAGAWCEKSGYRFSLKAACTERGCKEFVVTATPASSSTGARNFCSTSDGVIRSNVGSVLSMPLSAPECRKWPPLQ